MSNKLSAVLILCMSTVSLAGCDLLRVAGPCYGVGCPIRHGRRQRPVQTRRSPKPQNASAPAPAKPVAAPTQSASISAQPSIVQQSAPAQPATTKSPAGSAPAQPTTAQATLAQTAPAQDANAEAKSSPFHAIGEFFERLIPHHGSGQIQAQVRVWVTKPKLTSRSPQLPPPHGAVCAPRSLFPRFRSGTKS